MGTRGSVLFTDSYDQWVYVDTRYDGHTTQAAFEIATLPFARLARAEADLAASLAKGDPLWLDNKFDLTLETLARGGGAPSRRPHPTRPEPFLPFGPIANPFSKDGTPNHPDVGTYLARSASEGIIESLDHMERLLAFGEFDATSMARDFCSRQDRWIVSASGTGPIPAEYQTADLQVKNTSESRAGHIAITFACYLDEQTPDQLLCELSTALNAPLAPFHAYTVTPIKTKTRHDDEINLSITCSMTWVFACLLSRVMLAHPEFVQGLRFSPYQQDKPNQHDLWAAEGFVEPFIDGRRISHRFLMGLPLSAARIEANPDAAPRWLFTRNPRDAHDLAFGTHSPHGVWRLPQDSTHLSATVALTTALSMLGNEEQTPIAIEQIRALIPVVGISLLGSALDQAKSQGLMDNACPAAADAMAQIERELIQTHTPKAKKKSSPRKLL